MGGGMVLSIVVDVSLSKASHVGLAHDLARCDCSLDAVESTGAIFVIRSHEEKRCLKTTGSHRT